MTTQMACITVCPYAKCTSHTVIVMPSMKLYREELWVETKSRCAYMNITPQVAAAIRDSRVKEGLVLVNAMHITASVYIEDESGERLRRVSRNTRASRCTISIRRNRRGKCSCGNQTANHGARRDRCDYEWPMRLWSLWDRFFMASLMGDAASGS